MIKLVVKLLWLECMYFEYKNKILKIDLIIIVPLN